MMNTAHRYILTTAVSALMLTFGACSGSDSLGTEDSPLQGANVYFTIQLSVPTEKLSSRSQTNDDGTSTDGTEAGRPEEDAISNLHILLAGADGKMLSLSSGRPSREDNSTLTATISVPLDQLKEFTSAGSGAAIYALANYGASFNAADFDPMTATYSVASTADPLLTATSGLPMSNRDARTVTIPAETELVKHLSNSTPLDLTAGTPLHLERSVARIDYMDGGANHSFPLTNGEDQLTPTGYELTLASMEIFNIAKSGYMFRHTSPDGSDSRTELFGKETKTSFVMDCDANLKRGAGNNLPDGYFMSRTFGTELIDNAPKSAESGYSICCYVPENCIPAADKQLQGYSTGAHFRFKITKAPEGIDLDGTDPITVKAKGETKTVVRDADGNFYLDYYYFIKHNDNLDPAVMGPMEFGIVRNNIYRLKIESIDGLPEPYDPENPDEDPKGSLKLNVRIAKWYYEKIIFDM